MIVCEPHFRFYDINSFWSDTVKLWGVSGVLCWVYTLFILFSMISHRSGHLGLIVIVHSTGTINIFELLCWESCEKVKCIEISRVSSLCVSFWKRSMIFDAIDDLPYWARVRAFWSMHLRMLIIIFELIVLLFYINKTTCHNRRAIISMTSTVNVRDAMVW